MQRTLALFAALALALLGGAASAQWRGHGGRGEPMGFPSMAREVRPPGGYRGQGGPPRAPPPYGRPPPPYNRPPPPPIYAGDSLGADWGAQQDAARAGVRQHRYVPLGAAIESIRRRGPGRELDAGLEEWNGRAAYRVRWAEPNGRRIDYMVDAVTGAILGVDEGR
ncbi:MAG TPA: PepSY domain-containing protein [Caulobacteraceae bacterium]|nr:PepSY domain-containing protein [Caulobacteraceae bacterium]